MEFDFSWLLLGLPLAFILGWLASRFGGVDYPTGALFTLTSLDGLPLERSRRIRVYHGFGPARVRVGGELVEVDRETLVER